MNPLDLEPTVRQAANCLARKWRWGFDLDDLVQQGWVIALDAIPKYDPGKGDLCGYIYTAIHRALGNYLTKTTSAVTIPNASRWHELEVKQLAGWQMPVPPDNPTPEDFARSKQTVKRVDNWRGRMFDAICASGRNALEREIFFRAWGLNGFAEHNNKQIRDALGISRRTVQDALAHMNACAQIILAEYNQQLTEIAPYGVANEIVPTDCTF